MNYTYVCYIDSDGVLAAFEDKVSQIAGKPFSQISKGYMWKLIEDYNKTTPFFESLEKMPDADILWNFVEANFANKFILTATGYTPHDADIQKKNWYRVTYGPHVIVKTTKKSPDKSAFASPTSILIDDREKSIKPWIDAGGIGILHTNAKDTIEQLQKILDEIKQEA